MLTRQPVFSPFDLEVAEIRGEMEVVPAQSQFSSAPKAIDIGGAIRHTEVVKVDAANLRDAICMSDLPARTFEQASELANVRIPNLKLDLFSLRQVRPFLSFVSDDHRRHRIVGQ